MKSYALLFLSFATLTSTILTADTQSASKKVAHNQIKDKPSRSRNTTKDDNFKVGKIVALNETALKKKHEFTHLATMPSWDFGYGAPLWLTKPGAKVIVPRSNGHFTYGVVLSFNRPTITILVDKKADGSYETKEFRVDKLGSLKWIHRSWITKKRGTAMMNKEKAFVNYDSVTKNFKELAL